ncbi:hypothetical protein PJK45_30100, partial [Mycobacterium kansasii]
HPSQSHPETSKPHLGGIGDGNGYILRDTEIIQGLLGADLVGNEDAPKPNRFLRPAYRSAACWQNCWQATTVSARPGRADS